MSRRPRNLTPFIAIAVVGAVGLTLWQAPDAPASLEPSVTSPAAATLVDMGLASLDDDGVARINVSAISALLETLPASATAPSVRYDRVTHFGQAWADVDRNGCDTRNDILGRDITGPSFKPGTRDCKVVDGELHDVYTGQIIPFNPGPGIQIDHLWPLSLAWQSGAAAWSDDERLRFANDPSNLQAVDGPANQSKGDSGPSNWLPPAANYHCEYVARFVFIAAEYSLAISVPDRAAISHVLKQCNAA